MLDLLLLFILEHLIFCGVLWNAKTRLFPHLNLNFMNLLQRLAEDVLDSAWCPKHVCRRCDRSHSPRVMAIDLHFSFPTSSGLHFHLGRKNSTLICKLKNILNKLYSMVQCWSIPQHGLEKFTYLLRHSEGEAIKDFTNFEAINDYQVGMVVPLRINV